MSSSRIYAGLAYSVIVLVFGVNTFSLAGTKVYKLVPAESNSTNADSNMQAEIRQAVTRIRPHPRMILTNERVAEIKEGIKHNKLRAACVKMLIEDANAVLISPSLDSVPKKLHMGKACLDRIFTLGLAWRLTDDERYAHAMRDNLLAVCSFGDWNESLFIDVAEMTYAVAIGYDWLFDWLDDDSKAMIKAGIINKGINPGIKCYNTNENNWTVSRYYWNFVCNGGLIIGALAVADSNDLDKTLFILEHAEKSMKIAIPTYEPDGTWSEGIGYWGHAMDYCVYAMDALNTALGTDWGLSNNKGFAYTGDFALFSTGPTGQVFNYADTSELSKASLRPPLFWLAKRFNKPEYAAMELEQLSKRCTKYCSVTTQAKSFTKNRISAYDVIWWYEPNMSELPAIRKLDRFFKGEVEQVFMRSGWEDSNALFVAVKAGFNRAQHGHLDLGSFELDALGYRWARDLGKDGYNIDGYWDGDTDSGKRWEIYRLGSLSHNVIIIDNNNQLVSGKARISQFHEGNNPYTVIDINAVNAKVDSMKRTVALVNFRRAALVQDDIYLNDSATVTWQILTDAKIVCDKNRAILTLGSKKLIATIMLPADAVFVADSAEQKPPPKINKGVSRLSFSLKQDKGKVATAVLFSPVWSDGTVIKDYELNPKK